jgi:hypothetical protein
VIARIVRVRWPSEKLLLVVPCEAEWALGHEPEWGSPERAAGSELPRAPEYVFEPGALGVTDSRIVFQGEDRPGVSLRLAALLFAFVALAAFIGAVYEIALGSGALALGARWAGKMTEAMGLGGGNVELDGIERIDRMTARIHWVDRWGVRYRLHLSEPTFDQVTAVLPSGA